MLLKRSHFLATTAVVLALAIAGCGGGDGDAGLVASNNTGTGSGAGPGASPGPDAGQTADSFINKVLKIIGMTAENTEPLAIEEITVTSPDNTEPVPVS